MKSRRYWWLVAVVVLAGVAGAVMLWRTVQKPAVGLIQVAPSARASVAAVPTTYEQLKGQTFTAEYPSNFALAPMGARTNYTGTDNFVLASKPIATSDHLAISVVSDTGLVNFPAYHLRKLQPTVYTESVRQVGTDTAHIMTKTADGFEETVFTEHQGWLSIVSLTSANDSLAAQQPVVDHVLSSWHWTL